MWEDFGKLVKKNRKENGYSLEQLRQIIEKNGCEILNKSTISKWENGKHRPSSEIVEALEDIFGLKRGILLKAARYFIESPDNEEQRDALTEHMTQRQLAGESNFFVREHRVKHNEKLLEFIGRWEKGIGNIPINAANLLQEVYKKRKEGDFDRLVYPLSGTTIAFVFDFISDTSNKMTTVVNQLDEYKEIILINALRSHLSSSEYDELWESWDKLNERLVIVLDKLISDNQYWASEDLDSDTMTKRNLIVFECQNIVWYLAQIRLKGIIPGKCELCPPEDK